MTTSTSSSTNYVVHDTSQQNENSPLISLIDSINLTNLNSYYNNDDVLFKKRIDKLNLKFYLETEKCLDTKTFEDIQKSHNKLFLILFKQISLYIEEIERLNKIIIASNPNEIADKENSILRAKIRNLEKKCNDKTIECQRKQGEIFGLKKRLKKRPNIDIACDSSMISKKNSSIQKREISYSPYVTKMGVGSQKTISNVKHSLHNLSVQGKSSYISKSIEQNEFRTLQALNRNKHNPDVDELIRLLDDEYSDLCVFEKELLSQKNEIESTQNTQKDIFTILSNKRNINKKTNNSIINHSSTNKPKEKKIPLTSIKIDL